MSDENLIKVIAQAICADEQCKEHSVGCYACRKDARAALAVVQPEIDRLRGEVTAAHEAREGYQKCATALIDQAEANLGAAKTEISRMREVLRWYADQMCEFGPHYEGCGKMTDDDCAGCKARAALEDQSMNKDQIR